MVFLKLEWEPGYILELWQGWPFKTRICQQSNDSCVVTSDTSGISSRLGRNIVTPLEVRLETQGTIPVATGILGFLTIFKMSQASSPFEALNSVCLSRWQRDVGPPVEMMRRTRAFSRVTTGVSDIPSFCEMEDEPAFKPLQGNTSFYRVKASRCPFHLRQQTQGPSHIPIAERKLLLRCLWKFGILLESKPGNQLSSRDDLGSPELTSGCCAELGVHLELGWCSWGISGIA